MVISLFVTINYIYHDTLEGNCVNILSSRGIMRYNEECYKDIMMLGEMTDRRNTKSKSQPKFIVSLVIPTIKSLKKLPLVFIHCPESKLTGFGINSLCWV